MEEEMLDDREDDGRIDTEKEETNKAYLEIDGEWDWIQADQLLCFIQRQH